jgi:protein-tyrosine phosphatase
MKNVLFVCTGNICRSPMAEYMLRERLPELAVYSAGLYARSGACVDRLAADVAWKSGLDIRAHRARNISGWMVLEADLVLTMNLAQTHAIAVKYPAFRHKFWRLGEYGNFDVPDPYQKGKEVFREALTLITQGIDEWTASFLSTDSHQPGVPKHAYAL